MRVTRNMMMANFMRDLGRIDERSMNTQKQISSGIAIAKPSDDPAKAGRILFFDTKISKVEQWQRNIDHLTLWTSDTNTLLMSVYDTFMQGKELVQLGGTETMNQDQRDDLAAEVNGLIETLYGFSNDKIENYYAFGGNNLTTPPFTATRNGAGEITAVTYDAASASGPRIEEVLEGITENVNERGDDLLLNGTVDYFQTLIDARDNLRANTNLDVSLGQVNDAINDVDQNLARIGYKQARLESFKSRLDSAFLDYSQRKAGMEETDLVKAYTDYQHDQTLYQSVLAMGARIMSTSLIDFLR